MSDKRVIRHYDDLLARHDADHAKAGWGSAESQARRFEVFLDIGDLSGSRVLDVGCGRGALRVAAVLRDLPNNRNRPFERVEQP